MSDYFHGEDDPRQLAGDMELVVIGRDRRNLPCFGCFFGELFEAFTEEQLEHIDIGAMAAELDEADADRFRRLGAAMSVIADGMAFILADAVGAQAEEVAEVVAQKLLLSARLHSAPVDGRPN